MQLNGENTKIKIHTQLSTHKIVYNNNNKKKQQHTREKQNRNKKKTKSHSMKNQLQNNQLREHYEWVYGALFLSMYAMWHRFNDKSVGLVLSPRAHSISLSHTRTQFNIPARYTHKTEKQPTSTFSWTWGNKLFCTKENETRRRRRKRIKSMIRIRFFL